MDDRTFETLELKTLIELAARHVQTELGRMRILNLRPSTSRSEILRDLQITKECVSYLSTEKGFGFAGIENPGPIIAQLQIEGASLEPRQILALERWLSTSIELRGFGKDIESRGLYPNLTSITAGIPDMKHLLSAIHGKILPGGEIDDHASPELLLVRKELTQRRTRIHRTLESVIRNQVRAIQDEIITFRNGRFVIPVRTDSRNLIPGVVHGLSSSGQTTFVEPLNVINQNNDLVRLQEQEEIEISRILASITQSFRSNLDSIETIIEIVTQLDAAQAKGAFAAEFECVLPHVSEDSRLLLANARHILLEHSLRKSSTKAVPISLEIDENHPVLMISGPNAGGKTVALKTLGLISLMAQMGFHVPASEAHLPVFNQVFADIGDQQSISSNLSTFTAHMRNISDMAKRVHLPTLVLLDEVGTGTDPDEGSALAVAIVDYFRRAGATTIASTHYPRVKMWASQTAGVRNASVEFDEHTLQPTYRLILGVAGASSGLEIAKRMHVTEDILRAAEALMEPSHAQAREYLQQLKETLDEQNSLCAALEEERNALAVKYSELDADFARREELRKKELEEAFTRIVDDFSKESKRAIDKINDLAQAARIKKLAEIQAAKLRRKSAASLEDAQIRIFGRQAGTELPHELGADTDEIDVGDRVKVASLDREGVVESIREGIYAVIIGSLRYRSRREDLFKIRGVHAPADVPLLHSQPSEDTLQIEIPTELKVIGLTAEEARDRVDKFIDQAFLAGLDNICIIHGHGKGILRGAIADLLADHPQVERFRLAPPEQGGSGTTLVELRK
jgi:DNA mismatch repair protein MutS2